MKQKNPMKTRCVAWCVLFSMLTGGLTVRLYGLCTGAQLAQAAQNQRTYTISAGHARGTIYDCFGRPLTNAVWHRNAVVTASPEAVAAVRAVGNSALLTQMQTGKPVQTADWPLPAVAGTAVFSVPERYDSTPIAPHIIGYIDGDGHGVCGVEQAYDALLTACSGTVTVRYRADAWGRALTGDPIETTDTVARAAGGVVLTIDRDLQRIAEQAASSLGTGAVVIQEVSTGKLRAAASAPTFDPRAVGDALNRPDSPLVNRALAEYNVGSVFKLVAACAAAESGDTDLSIDCTGTMTYGAHTFRCIGGTAHGAVDLSRGIAVSCNCYFIRLLDRIGAAPVHRLAQRMGFGQPLWLTSTLVSGSVLPPLRDLSAPAALANFSFGQGELLASPVQVASMIQCIANNGYRIAPSLVECTVRSDGVRESSAENHAERVISARSAALVRDDMIAAVTSGTAVQACPSAGGAGAKTATAETGWIQNGKSVIQAWCAGFVPAESPQYVIVVFAENGRSGSAKCAPVFRQVANGIWSTVNRDNSPPDCVLSGGNG